jgi:hypothetical protein
VDVKVKALTCPICESNSYASFGWSVTFDEMMDEMVKHAREAHPDCVRDVGGITYIGRVPMVRDAE